MFIVVGVFTDLQNINAWQFASLQMVTITVHSITAFASFLTFSSTMVSKCSFISSCFCAALLCANLGLSDDRFLITDANGFSSGSIRDLALSSDGKWLAAAGEKQVRVWNVQTGTLKASIRGYQLAPYLKLGRANAVAFSPDGKELIVGVSDNTEDGSTRAYKMDDLDNLNELLPGHTACSDRVAFSADGKYFTSYG